MYYTRKPNPKHHPFLFCTPVASLPLCIEVQKIMVFDMRIAMSADDWALMMVVVVALQIMSWWWWS